MRRRSPANIPRFRDSGDIPGLGDVRGRWIHDDRVVTDLAPDPADVFLAVAGLESLLGRRSEARADYARAISLLSGRPRAPGDSDRRIAALVGLAAAAAASGDVLAASAAYREAAMALAEAAAPRIGQSGPAPVSADAEPLPSPAPSEKTSRAWRRRA